MKGRLLRSFYSNMKLKMDSNALISVFICCIVLVSMSSALASESSDIRDTQYDGNSNSTPSSSTQAQPPQWDIFAKTTVLGSSGISDYGAA